MKEIVPGILHWTALHERIGQEVSSYYVTDSRTLIDPMLPEAGLAAFDDPGPPERVLLSNRHHYRHSDRIADAFGCPVLCHEAGLHEFEGKGAVEPFRFGEEVAPGIEALELAAITPEDTAFHVAAGAGALAFADSLIRPPGGPVGFVPDALMDDPERVKRAAREAAARLLERDFDSLLFAHGAPLVGEGRTALERFSRGGG